MKPGNSSALKIVIAFTFTLVLAAAVVVVYQPSDSTLSAQIRDMSIASDSCEACHTNAQIIAAMASAPEPTASGGG